MIGGVFKGFEDLKIKHNKKGEFGGLNTTDGGLVFIEGDWDKLSCNNSQENIMPICPCSVY